MAYRKQRTINFKADLENFSQSVIAQSVDLCDELAQWAIDHVWTAYDRPTTGAGFTNRTFRLRKSIRARVTAVDAKIVMRLSASMPYAKYVENIKNGKFAYLGPTLNDMIPVAQKMMAEKLNIQTVYSDKMKNQRTRYQRLLELGRQAEKMGR